MKPFALHGRKTGHMRIATEWKTISSILYIIISISESSIQWPQRIPRDNVVTVLALARGGDEVPVS